MSNTDDQLVADYLRRLAAAAASLPADRRDELIEEISAHIAEARALGQDATGEAPTSVADTLARLGQPDEIVRAAAEHTDPGQSGSPTDSRPSGREGAGAGPGGLGGGYGPVGLGGAPGPGSLGGAAGPGGLGGGGYGPGGSGPGGAYPSWRSDYATPTPTASGMGALEIAAVILLLVGGILAGVGWIVGVILLWISPRWRLSDKLLGTLVWPGGLVGAFIVLSGGAFFAVGTVASVCYSSGTGQTSSQHCSNAAGSIPSWLGITLLLVAVLAGIGGPILVAIRLVRQARRGQQSYTATA